MPQVADQPIPAKRGSSLTWFYIAIGVVIALALFGFWFWRTWTVWWFDADEAKRRQVEAAAKLDVPVEKVVDLGDGVKLELVLIPAGRFRMGVQAGEDDDQILGHQWVQITKPFYMGKYEVTQEQFEKVMGANISFCKGARNPVENVSWKDCQDFLKKLNDLGKDPCRFRLPTEAEWEWACRAGTRTRFYSGDDEGALGEYAWCDANSGNTTHPVGEKKPNAWGLYDCHGNVMEWCGDWYEEYVHGWKPKADPTGPMRTRSSVVDVRVSRGGCWKTDACYCRSAYRHVIFPSPYNGLRVVLSLSRTP
jgi:formylglycine-generating enzyme required for sulfatase activity